MSKEAPFGNSRERGPNGRRLCARCGTEVPKGRQSWCSQKCIDEYLDRTDPARRRARVFERDGGICQLCGRGVGQLDDWLNGHAERNGKGRDSAGTYLQRSHFLRRRGLLGGQGQLYDCDHIVPQIEGGSHELENLRTLCVPCHKEETRKLAARRAGKPRLPFGRRTQDAAQQT